MFDTEIEIDDIPVLVMVEATLYGSFLPATRYEPAESPIVEDLKVTVISDGEELGGFPEDFDLTDRLSAKVYDGLAQEFFEWATDERNFECDEPDDYDDYDDYGY